VTIVAPAAAGIAAARQCKANGAAAVTVVVRASRERSDVSAAELEAAEAENIRCCFNAAVNRLSGKGARLESVDIFHLGDGNTETAPTQTLLLAAGRLPEMVFRSAPDEDAEAGGQSDAWEGIAPYKPPAYATETGLFSDGDVLTDFSGAIRAIAAGRRAAASVHRLMYDIGLELGELVVSSESQVQNVHEIHSVKTAPRQVMALRSSTETARGQELEAGFSPEAAVQEAQRCLQCGLICYEREPESQETGSSDRSAA
jgi:formate dehydrogenase beta subunit